MLISLLMMDLDIKTKLIYIAFYLIVIIVSFSIHEWGHAFAAHLNGDDTARNLGRMTLNPLAHIDPIGMLLLLIVGFGWAKPVPVNPRNYRSYKKGEFMVSFAGIFMNLVLALIAALVTAILYSVQWSALLEGRMVNIPENVYMFLYLLGIVNCSLAVFNFLPVYPLDGSHIFDLLFGKLVGIKVTNWMHNNGRIILYIFFAISILLSRVWGISIIGGAAEWIYDKFESLFFLIFGLPV